MQLKFRAMNIKTIKTEIDYNQALKRLEDIFHSPAETKEGDEAEIFSRKRKLTLKMIRNLHHKLKIPYESLMTDY